MTHTINGKTMRELPHNAFDYDASKDKEEFFPPMKNDDGDFRLKKAHRRKALTAEEIGSIIVMYTAENRSMYYISELLDVQYRVIKRTLMSHGIKLKARKLITAEQETEMIELSKQGIPNRVIATRLGLSITTVARRVKEYKGE